MLILASGLPTVIQPFPATSVIPISKRLSPTFFSRNGFSGRLRCEQRRRHRVDGQSRIGGSRRLSDSKHLKENRKLSEQWNRRN